MTGHLSISRRKFIVGGLMVAFACEARARAATSGAAGPSAIGGFVRISQEGSVSLVMPSVEMGQGIYTAEAALLAEELDVRLDQIVAIAAPPDASLYAQPLFKAQMTGGSTSIRGFWTPLRQAGAAARSMLVAAAARAWAVHPDECSTKDGTVLHSSTGRVLRYGEVAESAATLPIPEDPKLKSPEEFRVIGKSQRRIDTPSKVNGSAVYGIDVALDGMKTAAVVMCPVDGGKVRSVDEADARKIPGVIDVLRIDDAVAVVGEHYWAARAGVNALNVDWDLGPNAKLSTASIRAEVAKAAKAGTRLKALERGDVEAGVMSATRLLTAEYELPFLAHATMEPINTTVHVRPDGCDIWVGTQTPVVAQKHAARITGLPVEKVALHNHLIGGGFGRRLQADTIEQAVRFAKQVPYPLKIIWTREQDIRHDRFRPCYLDRLSASLDEQGRPSAWIHRTTSGTVRRYFDENGWPEGKLDKDAVEGAWDSPYAFPAIRVEWIRHDPPVKLNWWRGVGPTHNVFVVESFLDELAHAAGQDPIAYRRALLEANPRAIAVLDKVAAAAGWDRPQKPRSGRGVSLHQNFGTYAALVVEVGVALSGEISLTKIVAAVDCGIRINPDTVRAQIEGGVLFGLSAALFNGITFSDGRVEQGNFNDYRQLRINETPPIEVHLLESGENPGGLGEVGTVSAAPALGNAIFAATGVRVRRLPIDRSLLSKRENA
ncbi:xanthine dehydrogenase family protein molybdopterin-binding subunit [Bradyrhizobium sp. 6(2017)]|uniref:xanthine dehydrogenase family protein molybdopterin-binding subunit n=1 Tax=Bradyrhizobium sp. 6(2017) TaxID=1197460 RepID=UPI0013E17E9F|nr:xanthine dehydrogenase family protein molybdopterin-binding subunit [Bradyrhizobium sp. 6(2017)]QIG98102.1 xanthine dehydrogenase family protein molybdopterin-binding subunit [Bradyrhizobium sp. 6(2017)]